MKIKLTILDEDELKFVRESLEESIECITEVEGIGIKKEGQKDLEALKRVLDFYGG